MMQSTYSEEKGEVKLEELHELQHRHGSDHCVCHFSLA